MATKHKTGNLIDRLKWVLSLSVFTLAIVGNSYYSATPFLYRVLGVVGLFILGLVILALTDFGSNAIKLMRESRTELRRVVWPSRPETTQTFNRIWLNCCSMFSFLGSGVFIKLAY